ncbi:hypothetical protein QT971_16235 [Microcoleus sp. herbarium19]
MGVADRTVGSLAKPGVVHRDLQVESEHRQCQERSRRSPFALT